MEAVTGGQGVADEIRIVRVDLTNLAIGTWNIHAVAAGWGRRPTGEMVALISGNHKQRIPSIDAMLAEVLKKVRKALIIGFELGNEARLTWPEGPTGALVVVRVGDICMGNRDAVFLHQRGVSQADGRRETVEAGMESRNEIAADSHPYRIAIKVIDRRIAGTGTTN